MPYPANQRRRFLKYSGLLGLSTYLGLNISGCLASGELTSSKLIAAGNAREEKERWELLEAVMASDTTDPEIREQLRTLLPFVDRWANGRSIAIQEWQDRENKNYLPWPIREGDIDEVVPPPPPEDSPVYPLWCWYRSRTLIWQAIEYGEIQGHPEILQRYIDESRRLLQVAADAYPRNGIIRLYLGEREKWPTDHRASEKAPDWAVAQKTALSGLQDVIHWWITNRQLTDGQYGGGWGDDVEMWRWWTPALIGLQDQKIQDAQRRLSHGLFQIEKMKGGYTNRIDDVEHTAEDSADTITAMMHIDPTDEAWTSRARHLVHLMKTLWTGVNERGFLQFKSTYFTDTEVDLTPRKACDTVYHPRAVQPALLLWQRTRDPELSEIFTQWLKTWVDAAGRAERGKPAGIIPSAIHWPDGKVGGVGEQWWKPGNYTSNPLYVWPSQMGMMTNSLLLAFHITGDRSFLTPIISMAEIRQKYFRKGMVTPETEGSEDWCAAQMHRFLTGTLAKYRLITGDTQFDELLEMEQDPYVAYSFFGREDGFTTTMRENAAAFSSNFPLYTSEMRWTDRILNFNSHYLRKQYPETPVPNTRLLYSALTGDPGDPLYFPLNGFQWLTDRTDLSVRVKTQSDRSAEVELFGFFDGHRSVPFKTYLLQPGSYQLVLADESGKEVSRQEVQLTEQINRLELKVPGKRALRLQIY
ncbi:hypothetical protein [Flavilitoribacter nigricans]|uniref:hypothetical protein n=1 Tax=Flavilitoribacter nigricans TaxID=70997 RepID=UPI00117AB9D1|nr:hypothetical protein [Flavilitoribacter nigricans]